MRIIATAYLAFALTSCGDQSDGYAGGAVPHQDNPVIELSVSSTDEPLWAVPESFLGTWDVIGSDCRENSDMRIEFRPEGIVFYESVAAFTSIEMAGPLKIQTKSNMKGEGYEWSSEKHWQLEGDGEILVRQDVDKDGFDEPIQYRRCPI